MKASQNQKYNILYGRLSQEDERQGESNSIHNQRLLLEQYARENGFQNTLFLADDGYSGTNFERPSWKKIVEMIENGQVETLIVKDLSRLGREYLQVGYYTEIYFPQKGVRFIAVNDGVDSLVEGSNDFNPIRNWANELHAKESSKKVRAVKRMQAQRGERTGGAPPYGYKKKAPDSKEIVPDEVTAPVVQRIFSLCAAGKGPFAMRYQPDRPAADSGAGAQPLQLLLPPDRSGPLRTGYQPALPLVGGDGSPHPGQHRLPGAYSGAANHHRLLQEQGGGEAPGERAGAGGEHP